MGLSLSTVRGTREKGGEGGTREKGGEGGTREKGGEGGGRGRGERNGGWNKQLIEKTHQARPGQSWQPSTMKRGGEY